jgi:putative ABC transport system permease protein
MNPPVPGVFAPHAQSSQDRMWITIRGRGEEAQLIAAARTAVHSLDNQLVMRSVRSMRQVVDDSLSSETVVVWCLNGFAGFSLLLAAIGIYGIVEYSAKQRTHETGIRFALGAKYSNVLRLALREGLVPVIAGVFIGIPAALVSVRFVRSLLVGINPFDATVFLCVPLSLIFVAVVASLLPARRSAGVNPITALRGE